MEPKVIYKNSLFMVLDKPAGWIVNEAETTGSTPVIQSWLRENFDYPIVNSQHQRSGVVHRLDKETSGILLVAETLESFDALQLQFKKREVKKTYTALVHGRVQPQDGEIRTTVGRLPWRRDRFGIIPGGRESLTKYHVTGYYELSGTHYLHLKDYSLMEFYPETGRTHQIRIHTKYIGHPVVSDDFYAGRKTAREDRRWCSRLFLHASGISFLSPQSGERVHFESELPDELSNSLKLLTKAS